MVGQSKRNMSSGGRRKSALSDQLRHTPPEQRILSASSGDLTTTSAPVSSLPVRLLSPSCAVSTTAFPSNHSADACEIAIAPLHFGSLSAANRSLGAYGSIPKELSSSFFGGGGSVTSRISSSYLVRPNIPAISQVQSNLGFHLGVAVSNSISSGAQAAPQQLVIMQPATEVRSGFHSKLNHLCAMQSNNLKARRQPQGTLEIAPCGL